MEKRLNTIQAAQHLKGRGTPFTPGTLEVWRSLGKGPRFIRVGGRIFYEPSALDAFIKGQTVQTIDSIDAGKAA